MFCPKCGKERQESWKFCPFCNSELPANQSIAEQQTITPPPLPQGYSEKTTESLPLWCKIPGFRTKTKWKMAIATACYGFILLIFIALISSNPDSRPTINKSGAKILADQAESLYSNKDYSKALAVLNELMAKHPNDPETTKVKTALIDIEKLAKQEQEERAKAEKQKAIEAEKKAAELEKTKARQAAALNSMRKKHDEVKDLTWFHDRSTTQYTNETDCFIYFGKEKTGTPWLRFRIQYAAKDWLFIKKFICKADDRVFEIVPKHGDVQRDVYYGGIVEWFDTSWDIQKYEIVKAIISAEKTILRCEGDKYYKDRVITRGEINAFKNVLDAYQAAGGVL